MKKTLGFALFLHVATWPALAADHGAKTLDDAFTKAFNANDLNGVVALYAPDAKLYPPDAMQTSGPGIRENYAAFLGSTTVKDFKLVDATYETSGDLSVGWGRFSLTAIPKKGGQAMAMEGRYTSVAKKRSGKWLYVADHASVALPPPPPEFPKPASQPAGGRR